MFQNLGIHIIHFPSGKYGFVGTLPVCLADVKDAAMSDVLGGRAFRDESGKLVAPCFPVFPTEKDAREFAASRSVSLSN